MLNFRRTVANATLAILAAATANASTILIANLTTTQETSIQGPTTSTGAPRPIPFGTATFVLNDAMDAMSFTATIFNIDVTGSQTPDNFDNLTAAHIHAGPNTPPAANGVVWGFFGNPFNNTNPNDQVNTPFATGVGGTFSGTWNAPEGNNTTLAAQLPNILAGRAYINFHTVQNPGGEIRGALQLVPEPSSVALVALGGLAVLMARRRRSS